MRRSVPAGPAPMMATFLPVGGGLCWKGVPTIDLSRMLGSSSRCCVRPIGDETLQPHDVDRLVVLAAAAGLFTAVVAYPPAHRREGMLAPDGPVGIGIALLVDQGDIALGALVGGAGGPAGSDALSSRWRTHPERTGQKSGKWLCACSGRGRMDC